MNVWVSKPAGDAIDRAIETGRFKSRQEAIAYALEAIFIREERNVVTYSRQSKRPTKLVTPRAFGDPPRGGRKRMCCNILMPSRQAECQEHRFR